MRVRRFASLAELDASRPAVEEREGIEPPRAPGLAVFAGVDTAAVLAAAEREADVLVWDGDDDLPFVRPGLHVVVVDPLRPGHELAYHPGEANLRLADVVVVSRVDAADPADVERVLASVRGASPRATVVLAESPVTLEPGPPLEGRRVLVVEDGPPLTRGGMPFGAGTVAARAAGAELVDPRPWAVGSVAETLAACPWIGAALPAAGYGPAQLADLERTIDAVDCDVVVAGTPVDLARLVRTRHPIRRARSELRERGRPTLHEAIAPIERLAHTELGVSTG
jgi:predicted GTPase